MRAMFRTLLADRFKLTTRRERRDIASLLLVEVKGGHKMTPSAEQTKARSVEDPVKGNIVKGWTMTEFAESITHELRIPVVDSTGLKGRFDFPLNIRAAWERNANAPPAERMEPVGIYQALLQQEPGLKLDSGKRPVDVLVIEHIEKNPIEN